ncbi:MAG: VWA domain-containing protein [Sedimentisphaerales bacterium]|nr:VWA domain-containing protein [Sedimentisphaerales bacterium]
MIKKLCLSIVLVNVIFCASAGAVEVEENRLAKPPLIQMAILLDTSGSMSGLIDQAKTQLWSVVNEFATARKNGQIPEFQVALYEYGKSSIPAEEGYIRMILPLTTDLDEVSEELFALNTNGGDEYCGMVIKTAVESLSWSDRSDDFKVIFIAGNEPFTQGTIDYRDACKAAIEKGILVNTIHCGSYEEGEKTKWMDGAILADGSYMHIDHNRQAVHIETPFDKEIVQLGEDLNQTYVAYGALGTVNTVRQQEQDMNAAAAAPGAMVQRSISKSSVHYRNSSWDLVDAVKENTIKLEELEDEDLPEEMAQMTPEERQDYLETKKQDRDKIQQQINELNDQRKIYVAEEMKKRTDTGEDTLEKVMIKAIREQVKKNSFSFEPENTPTESK